jgi:hypothetical protein
MLFLGNSEPIHPVAEIVNTSEGAYRDAAWIKIWSNFSLNKASAAQVDYFP